jgi:hypothetical protein
MMNKDVEHLYKRAGMSAPRSSSSVRTAGGRKLYTDRGMDLLGTLFGGG